MFFLLRHKKVGTLKKSWCLKHVKKEWTFQVSAHIAIVKGDRVDNFQKQGKSLEFSVLHRWLKICIDLHGNRQISIYSSSCISSLKYLRLFKSMFVWSWQFHTLIETTFCHRWAFLIDKLTMRMASDRFQPFLNHFSIWTFCNFSPNFCHFSRTFLYTLQLFRHQGVGRSSPGEPTETKRPIKNIGSFQRVMVISHRKGTKGTHQKRIKTMVLVELWNKKNLLQFFLLHPVGWRETWSHMTFPRVWVNGGDISITWWWFQMFGSFIVAMK